MARKPKLIGKEPGECKQSKPIILIYGDAKTGKTMFSLDFPMVYYIDTEGGASRSHYQEVLAKNGGAYVGPDQGSNSFDVVIGQVEALATTDHPYKTLVIDSYSKLFNTDVSCELQRFVDQGKYHGGESTFGAEKKNAIRLTTRLIRWFQKMDMNVILVCHEKEKWRKQEVVGVTYDGWDKLKYELDLSFRTTVSGKKHMAEVVHTRLNGGGMSFPKGASFPLSFDEFAKRYGKDIIERSREEVLALASDEQIDRLNVLIDLTKTPVETQSKWKSKAAVDNWGQMDSVTIGKCINALEKKLEVAKQ